MEIAWLDWSLPQFLLVFAALAFLMIFLQVVLFHSRQNFRHWTMWLPVLETPVASLLLLSYVFYPLPLLKTTTALFLSIGALSGLSGFALHTSGVGQRVGGYTADNFRVGPPVMLPLMIAAISVLGLLAIYWR